MRRRLPDERHAITHKFTISGHEGYLTVGLYPDTGQPGEIFIVMAKEGSVVSGLVDCFATAISLALQYGVPLKVLVDKFVHSRFEPSGITANPEIRFARSIADYIFRWLALKFLPGHEIAKNGKAEEGNGVPAPDLAGAMPQPVESQPPSPGAPAEPSVEEAKNPPGVTFELEIDAPPCPVCGSLMVRRGSCTTCLNCGTSNGCAG